MVENEDPKSTSPSPLELQEVDQIKKKEEEEVRSHEPSFIEGSLKMSKRNIHEALSILHDTQALEDHEKCGNLNVLDVFEVELEEIQTLDEVE